MSLPRAIGRTVSLGVAAGALYLSQTRLYLDELPKPRDKRPPTLWTPPTRKEMLAALKASRSLPPEQSDARSADFTGLAAARDDDKGKTVDRGSDEDEYDLLIIGGGATGAGCARLMPSFRAV